MNAYTSGARVVDPSELTQPSGPHCIAGYVPMSAQLADEIRMMQEHYEWAARVASIGPPHHPDRADLPRGRRLLLELPGHPAGRLHR